jgi:calcineurin-like phosphoesterase family protein
MQTPNIDPSNTWIVSDTHFGHLNIVGFQNRPDEHEEIMVRNWADAVPASATVLHLGDLSYRNNAYFRSIIAPKLTGKRKLLILGNHDKQRVNFYRTAGFKIIKPFDMRYEGYVVSFSHYPLQKPAGEKYVRVHGHIHASGYGGKTTSYTPFSRGQINVSVEQTHYTPVNLENLLNGYIKGCYEP